MIEGKRFFAIGYLLIIVNCELLGHELKPSGMATAAFGVVLLLLAIALHIVQLNKSKEFVQF